jgi:hypothetical protein
VNVKEIVTNERFTMSEYTQPPNENWVEQNSGKRLLLEFHNSEYIVTIEEVNDE